MKVGIVGHAADKFTDDTELEARKLITDLLLPEDAVLVSGGCHLGGVDIWAEEVADWLGRPKIVFKPATLSWSGGYKDRNLKIAGESDTVNVIVVRKYPSGYVGMRFSGCYHCKGRNVTHIKSGGCWTAWQAIRLGGEGRWWYVG